MPIDRPRVLLKAEAAIPEWTSVPLEGWSHSRAIQRIVSSLIVTQIRNVLPLMEVEFSAASISANGGAVCRLSHCINQALS